MAGVKFDRYALLTGVAGILVVALLAIVAWRIAAEHGGTNSYAMLADALRNGRLDVERCLDADCAYYAGKTWVVFPPAPAITVLPFVAMFGSGFAGFILLATLISGLTLWLWWRIFRALALEREHALWLVAAIFFATPLYYVTIRGDGVWFYAQVAGSLFLTAALHEAIHRRLWSAGIALGLAFLSRQMILLQAPFLFALALQPDEPLISLRRQHITRALALGLPLLAAVALYLAYNAARFGNPFDTGYAYISPPPSDAPNFITHRLKEVGLFSRSYVPFNAIYLFLQGFHIDFAGRYLTELGKIDAAGTSLLAASPFVLLAFFAPMRRELVVGLLTATVIAGVALFYHSNGYSQYNAQRYTLDWLPVIFLALALGPAREHSGAFRLLVVYALGLNAATMFLLALTAHAA
jgi:hypothetical protein